MGNQIPGMEDMRDAAGDTFRAGAIDVYMLFPQVSSMSKDTTAPNTDDVKQEGDMLYGRPLPVNDSPEAIASDMTSIEKRMDAMIAKVSRALSK
jgi:hypothetical protein